ncbi:MAG: DUF5050 domain-containing protein [Clostridia bacterium]|nr:DUF5050 domain-containing protein [Clostridia bacterium]
MANFLTGRCPNCDSKLEYSSNDSVVVCNACDSSISVAQLQSNIGASAAPAAFSPMMMLGFDNPESGVVFVENFFENYDWADYQDSTEIKLYEINEVIENNKIKNGADAHSWYLAFKGLAVPVSKKIEGLALKTKYMHDQYNSDDNSESFAAFDTYRRVVEVLVAQQGAIVKELESAIKYAEKFNLASDKLAEIKAELDALKAQLSALHPVNDITEIPEYLAAQHAADERLEKEFAETKGVNARSLYEAAVQNFNAGGEAKRAALRSFTEIRGYADSNRYIQRINHYYKYFDGDLFFFGDKYYLFRREAAPAPTFDVKNLGNNIKGKLGKKDKNAAPAPAPAPAEQPTEAVKTLSLYEVVVDEKSGKPVKANTPVLRGIEQVIKYFNNCLYFFNRKGICKFDLIAKSESVVDTGKLADYKAGGKYQTRLVLNETHLLVKKKLQPKKVEEAKKGCLSFLPFGKKQAPAPEKSFNNYELLLIDLMTGEKKAVVSELVDVALAYDKELFYVKAESLIKPAPAKKGFLSFLPFGKKEEAPTGPEFKTELMFCNLKTGACSKILNEDCQIHNVVDGKVIYTHWEPVSLNQDLFVYDIASGESTLIENNIYSYFDVIGGKVYYTIGNKDFRPLVRANFDGSDRKELMRNVERVISAKGNWLYLKKGSGRNAAIVKFNVETGKRVIICTQVDRILRETSTHIHYVDIYNNLRVVRTDGKENKLIAENFETFFIVGKDCIYYARNEAVDTNASGLSLYVMDPDGNNSRKLVFNVESISDYDEEYLYYKKVENVRFKVTKAIGKGQTEESFESRKLTSYYKYNKETGKSEEVLLVGWPTGSSTYQEKTGCLAKFGIGKTKEVKTDNQYDRMPAKCRFKYRGLAAVGAVEAEHAAEEEKKNNPAPAAPNAPAANNTPAAQGGILGALVNIKNRVVNFFKNIFKK